MKKIGVITDSHSGILPEEAKKLGIQVLPMPFYCEGECYFEGVSITREELFQKMKEGKTVSTSQPSPEDVMNIWTKALEQFGEIVYIPMSSGLSGSCATAQMLAQEPEFEKKIHVVDNGRISATLRCAVLDALRMIEKGFSASEIKTLLEEKKNEASIYVTVENLEYLKRGGRISGTTATLGKMLNIKPVLRLGNGILDTHCKARGMKKARHEMLDAMEKELTTTYRDAAASKEIYLLAASSADEATSKAWEEEIQARFPDFPVHCENLSMGLCCHVGEGALGIGCSVYPDR